MRRFKQLTAADKTKEFERLPGLKIDDWSKEKDKK